MRKQKKRNLVRKMTERHEDAGFDAMYGGKDVIVWKKNGFKYEGMFLGENDFGIFIDDVKIGKKFIAFSDIKGIDEVRK